MEFKNTSFQIFFIQYQIIEINLTEFRYLWNRRPIEFIVDPAGTVRNGRFRRKRQQGVDGVLRFVADGPHTQPLRQKQLQQLRTTVTTQRQLLQRLSDRHSPPPSPPECPADVRQRPTSIHDSQRHQRWRQPL